MSYLSEFPDYDGKLYIPDGFADYSWHNDIMPRSQKVKKIPRYGNEPEVDVAYIIWQDYIDPELREYDNGKRYIFQIEINGECIFEYKTDDLDDLKMVIAVMID